MLTRWKFGIEHMCIVLLRPFQNNVVVLVQGVCFWPFRALLNCLFEPSCNGLRVGTHDVLTFIKGQPY